MERIQSSELTVSRVGTVVDHVDCAEHDRLETEKKGGNAQFDAAVPFLFLWTYVDGSDGVSRDKGSRSREDYDSSIRDICEDGIRGRRT